MWTCAKFIRPVEKKQRKNTAILLNRNIPVQANHRTKESGAARKNIRILYNRPVQEVIQKKQTTSLGDRLREQGIVPRELGTTFAELVEGFDALSDTADTRAEQRRYLYELLDTLHTVSQENPQVKTTLRILRDELYFVNNSQTPDTPETSTASNALQDPWSHLDSSPFIRMIAELARQDIPHHTSAHPNTSTASANRVPAKDIPSQENFSAFRMIQTLSRHHKEQLLPMTESAAASAQSFFHLYDHVNTWLLCNCMLSHYSHKPDLTVLHSTDYLKANRMLEEEGLDKTVVVDETKNVSKSQRVDMERFLNTGFVFFFLEKKNSPHRHTDFGEYRYTLPLAEHVKILADAWAIMHDMAQCPVSGRPIYPEKDPERKKLLPKRIFESVFVPDQNLIEDLAIQLQPALTQYLTAIDPSNKVERLQVVHMVQNMLSLFLPTAEQKVLLQTPDGEKHDTGIHDHLSGNFLHGTDIVNIIALRITHDLKTLQECSIKEYNAVMNDENAFWRYVSEIVHNVQIMIPHDVLPMECDFVSKS